MELREVSNVDIDDLYEKMLKQFPLTELKTKKSYKITLENPHYKVFYIYDGELNCGHFAFLELEDNTILIDYLTINKELHSHGYGTKAIQMLKSNSTYKGCYLEVEKINPEDIDTIRRVKFYKNLGAVKLDINYFYPNYEGSLAMDLYFIPFRNDYVPKNDVTLKNLEYIFSVLHFDLTNTKEVLETIKQNS